MFLTTINKQMINSKNDALAIIVSPLRFPTYTKGRICECSQCNKEAWLSDTSIDAARTSNMPVKFICLDCFVQFATNEEITLMGLTPDQIAEIKSISSDF